MIQSRFLASLAPYTTLAVIALGVWTMALGPQGTSLWAVGFGVGFLPTMLIGMTVLPRLKGRQKLNAHSKQILLSSISLAGLILALAFGLEIARTLHLIASQMPDRLVAVALGVILMLIGNQLPKLLQPMQDEQCQSARSLALKRFAGWMLVLAGFGYGLVWLILPVSDAGQIAITVLGAPLALMMARIVWVRFISRAKAC